MRSPFADFAPLASGELAANCEAKAEAPEPVVTGKKLSWRPLTARIAPLVKCTAPATVSKAQPASRDQPNWKDLPLHLLEDIFALLFQSSDSNPAARKDMFAAVGVCKLWRRTGFELFFLRPPVAPADIVHPLQLLSLSSKAVQGNLLRCFVRREVSPRHGFGSALYCMYLGTAHHDPSSCKFLLAARQTCRREILIYMDRKCEGRPIARLLCSPLQMKYRIHVTPCCALPFVDTLVRPDSLTRRPGLSVAGILLPRLGSRATSLPAAGAAVTKLPPVLAEVQYHLRLKGFMRPRKMRVTLPHPLELACFEMDEPAAMQRLASVCGTCPLPEPEPSGRSMIGGSSGSAAALRVSLLRRLRSNAPVMASAHSAPPSALDAAADAALEAAGLAPAASAPGNTERLPLGLRNKQPHWNDNLRCHCLNFHGRVKEASVKNFQLVCADAAVAAALSSAAEPPPGGSRPTPTRAARAVAMQFGKVETDLYILDYNPTVITGLQAFCVALTNFDCKLLV